MIVGSRFTSTGYQLYSFLVSNILFMLIEAINLLYLIFVELANLKQKKKRK